MRATLVDTDIVSLFAKTDSLGLLLRLFQVQRLPITPGVFNELLTPLMYGHSFPRAAFAVCEMIALQPDELEQLEELRLGGRISAADAEQIAVCHHRNWLYITMDRIAAQVAQQHSVVTLDLRALLAALLRSGVIDRVKLQTLIDRMEEADKTRYPFREQLLQE